MAQGVEAVASQLQGTGFYNLVLPFILVFAIVYGLLSELELFGENDKPNLIIAIVLAIFAAVFFPMSDVLSWLQGPWALWLILILMVMIALQLAGIDVTGNDRLGYGIGGVAVLGTVYLFTLNDRGNALASVFCTNPPNGGTSFPACLGLNAQLPGLGDIGIVPVAIILIAIGLVYWMFKD